MTVSTRVREAAARVLAGDESVQAANLLESTILDDHFGDERFDDLIEGLALYAPGQPLPYVGAAELRTLIEDCLQSAGDSQSIDSDLA